MLRYIRKLYLFLVLGFQVYFVNALATKRLVRQLNKLLKTKNTSLSAYQIGRIRSYVVQSYITTRWFSILRGYESDKNENFKAQCMGAITPIVDDLIDTEGFNSEEIFEKIKDQKDNLDSIILIRYLYECISTDTSADFDRIFKKAIAAQDASSKQLSKEVLSEGQLRQISFDKGGYSTLLYRTILKHPLKKGEEESIYLLGNLLQLTNDLFDVHKDHKAGQQTLFTNATNLKKLNEQYLVLLNNMVGRFWELEYEPNNIKKFLREVMLVVSRGAVCFDQLLACQKKNNDRFEIDRFSREELVCDMEKVSNILKCIKQSLLLDKLIEKRGA